MNRIGNDERAKKRTIILVASVIAFSLLLSVGAYAWFYYSRRAAAVAEISNPTALYINAGQQEDIIYLNLSGIDLRSEDHYKDFVFCIRGISITKYAIQLAYTTNNRFEYELYPASYTGNDALVPNNCVGSVEYYSHTASPIKITYYIENGKVPIPGSFKNLINGQILAEDNDSYYEQTYGDYTEVHQYARPLYWQSLSIYHTDSPTGTIITQDAIDNYVYNGTPVGDFVDYYILRVKWDETRQNDKETDIIYLVAKTFY